MKRAVLAAALATVIATSSGCATIFGTGISKHDNAARLMARDDAPAARAAAPGWTEEALKTINALEYELERK